MIYIISVMVAAVGVLWVSGILDARRIHKEREELDRASFSERND